MTVDKNWTPKTVENPDVFSRAHFEKAAESIPRGCPRTTTLERQPKQNHHQHEKPQRNFAEQGFVPYKMEFSDIFDLYGFVYKPSDFSYCIQRGKIDVSV